MKYQEIKTLLDRHPELDSEVLDMDEVREYLIYGNDGQKVIAQVISLDYEESEGVFKENALLDCFVGRDHIEIPIDEIRSMELVVKFSDLPSECCVVDPKYAIENVFAQNDEDYEMPITLVRLGVKGYFKFNLGVKFGVKSQQELMELNMLRYGIKYQEVVDIMLDQSMFNADADHIINHKYDAKLRLTKSEREAI